MKPHDARLTLERADNGITALWYSRTKDGMERHYEVFNTSGALISRIDGLLELFELDTQIHASQPLIGAGHIDPATDPDVAALAAPNTPPTVPTGD